MVRTLEAPTVLSIFCSFVPVLMKTKRRTEIDRDREEEGKERKRGRERD